MRTSYILPAVAILLGLQIPANAQKRPLFNPTNFVVVGEGLAAGMGDFSLKDIFQDKSFPNQMATNMGVAFPQPLFEGSGVGNVPGFAPLPVRYPGPGQGSVRKDFPPQLFVFNLSVPGFHLADAFNVRPSAPVIQVGDMQKTLANLILGYPALILPNKPLWTQVEYAQSMNPTFAMIELGYFDVLDAATNNDLTRLPNVAAFTTNYTALVKALRGYGGTEVLATTVPNPFDTGYFTTVAGLSRLVPADTGTITSLYGLKSDDLVTIPGVIAMTNQMRWNETPRLPAGSVLSASTAAAITANVAALNTAIGAAAQANKALVFDLNATFHRIRTNGLLAGGYVLTADYLGGFYTLDGYYPGWTGNAQIASEILTFINQSYGTRFPLIGLAPLVLQDPAVRHSIPYAATPIPPQLSKNAGGVQ